MYLIQDDILSKCFITESESVLVALSGGSDSVALLLEMKRLHSLGKIKDLAAAHMNHMIRGNDAAEDASFCKSLCIKLDIPFFTDSADVPEYANENGLSLETAARILRYSYLEKIRNQHGYTCIAVGHHKNDQAETVLLHLLRGSGTDGLAGMRYRSGFIVRPFLDVTKDDIFDYLLQNDQQYCNDSTNSDLHLRRNYLRNQVIPMLEHINPKFIESMSKTSYYVSLDSDYLQEQAENAFISIQNRYEIAKLHPAIKMRVLKHYLPYDDYESIDIETLSSLLTAQTGTSRSIKYGYHAWVDSFSLHIDHYNHDEYSMPFIPGERIFVPGKVILSEYVSEAVFPCASNELFLDTEKLSGPLRIRSSQTGDRFTPFGMNHTKLLSDYFTDKKVPRFQRNYPILTDTLGIIAVLGNTIDNRVRITANSKNILHITLEEVHNELG